MATYYSVRIVKNQTDEDACCAMVGDDVDFDDDALYVLCEYVVNDERTLVGMAGIKDGCLRQYYVHSRYRKKGVAKRMTKSIWQLARVAKIWREVVIEPSELIDQYPLEKYGFKKQKDGGWSVNPQNRELQNALNLQTI